MSSGWSTLLNSSNFKQLKEIEENNYNKLRKQRIGEKKKKFQKMNIGGFKKEVIN